MINNWIFPVRERFRLSEKFIDQYRGKQPKWGPLGLVTYKRTYARPLPDGKSEEFWQTVERVVNGIYTTQLNHVRQFRLPWSAHKAQHSAQRMFQLMWEFKFLPPGRGLWLMGTDYAWERGSACLQNCGAVSTKNIDVEGADAFMFMADMSMMGVGVSFDVAGAGKLGILEPKTTNRPFVVEDSKGGWVSVVGEIVNAYFGKGTLPVEFDYSLIRPAGSPIMGFGGIAPGPGPLQRMESELRAVLDAEIGKPISSTIIADLMNIVGKCVVSGGVRRSSQLILGNPDDEEYLKLKDPEAAGQRLMDWRWASNNSIYADVGMDYSRHAAQAAVNGEPGFVWIDNCRHYGRTKDGWGKHDTQVVLVNPCVTGDTLVAVADGRGHVRIDQIEDGTPVYCLDDNQEIAIRPMRHPRITGYDVDIYKVTLDDGSFVRTTKNHRFLTSDWSYKEVSALEPGDSLKIITRYLPDFRTESRADQYITYSWCAKTFAEHVELAKYKFGLDDLEGKHVHHLNGNKRDNRIENLALEDSFNHLQDHSVGLSNPRAIDISNEELIEIGVALCKTLQRRFSVDEWQKYAKDNGIPSQFSEYRVTVLGKVDVFAKRCAALAGIDLPDVDPRTLRFYLECVEGGYDTEIIDGTVYVRKQCEVCEKDFTIEAVRREQCKCSFSCNNRARDYSKNKDGQKKTFDERRAKLRVEQAKVLLDMKAATGMWPQRKEWMVACKAAGVTSEMGRKGSPFLKYDELKAFAEQHNHRVVSVEYAGKSDVWNGTVDDYHNFFMGAFENVTPHGRQKVCYLNSTQCGEQSLENRELCVANTTRVQTKHGCPRIGDIVGQKVEVWNGEEWSEVTPRQTGTNRELYRVHLSDGSYLDCTENHAWSVQCVGSTQFKRVEAKDLRPEDVLESFSIPVEAISGVREDRAYWFGHIVGNIHYNEVVGRENGDTDIPFIEEILKDLRTLPEIVFGWDRESILDFVVGWAGGYGLSYSKGIYLRGTGGVLRDLQILLRRAGINKTTLTEDSESESGLLIHRSECKEFESKFVNVAPDLGIESNQSVVRVEKLDGLHDTYCFEEPKRHMGVFGNTITFQCNLVETFPSNHDTFDEYMQTLKYAYLYGKTVTLIPTHNDLTNAVMWRNRRIGLSQSGIIQSFQKHGRRTHFEWCDKGYDYIQELDEQYSGWLGIPLSKKTTTVKPSGSISLLPGVTPGIHYPHSEYYKRAIRVDINSPMISILQKAGYQNEPSAYGDNTIVFYFPVHEKHFERSKNNVTIWEQMENAAQMQHYWADNQISITVTFDPEKEAVDISKVLEMYETRLKVVSFLPNKDHGYVQAPYQEITKEEYDSMIKVLKPIEFKELDTHEVDEKFCNNDTCEIK